MLRIIIEKHSEKIDDIEDKNTQCTHKLVHPRVLKALEKKCSNSPVLLIKDAHQPLNGDLRMKCSCNCN